MLQCALAEWTGGCHVTVRKKSIGAEPLTDVRVTWLKPVRLKNGPVIVTRTIMNGGRTVVFWPSNPTFQLLSWGLVTLVMLTRKDITHLENWNATNELDWMLRKWTHLLPFSCARYVLRYCRFHSTLTYMDAVNCAPPCIKERKTTNGFLNITNVMIRPVSRDGSFVWICFSGSHT